jgi:4-hydroxy-3-methylbut-2-enyl diphosphate reductase
MKIIRAEHLGMCFGVRDAITLATETARHHPLTILGDLVHNADVVGRLQRAGVRIEESLDRVRTATVLTTAHGVSQRRLEELGRQGRTILEATCPLVKTAHEALRELAAAGYHPVVVGMRSHVEVRGLTEDWDDVDVVLTADDVNCLRERARFGVVAQTTQPIQRVWRLADLIRHRFPRAEVRVVDTVCRPTKLRQWSAERLGAECKVVVVVGGVHSNNTRQLAETCRRHGARAYQVERAEDLRVDWFVGTPVVGLTAGTSTPDDVIDEVEARLHEVGEMLERKSTEKRSSKTAPAAAVTLGTGTLA